MGPTSFERAVLAEVSKETCWRHVEWFAAAGEKLSGTPNNERAVDYVLETLKGYGVPASAPEFQAWLDFPRLFDAELKVVAPEARAIEAMALAQIASTPPEGVEGELVYVGGGGLQDYMGKNARNKVVLVDFNKWPARPWKNYVAGVLKGAAGMIVVNYPAPRRVFNRGTVKSVWGNPTPDNMEDVGRIPAVNVSSEDGAYLKGLLEKRRVRIWMRVESAREWARTRQPMATIRGSGSQFVLLGSHMDAWGGAASCNAVGCASTLETARVMMRYLLHLRRGVELLWFQGHETGIMAGSTWYVDSFWDRLHKSCVAYLNNDTPSMINTTVYKAESDPVLQDFIGKTVSELAEEEGVSFKAPRRYLPVKTGDQSFLGLGIPSVRVLTTIPEELERTTPLGGWWYHSDQDTIDKVDPDTLHMANRAQVLVLLRLCTLPVLPYKIGSTAVWMLDSLRELEEKAGEAFDLSDLVDRFEIFEKYAVRLDEATAKLQDVISEGKPVGENELTLVNEGLLRICRILNPVNYTLHGKYEQDHYGAEYIRPIPALQPVTELVALNPDTSLYKAMRTKLVRARNMVSVALDDAEWFTVYVEKKIVDLLG